MDGLRSRLLRSQYYGLRWLSFGSFCLSIEQPVSPTRLASNCGDPSNGLGSWSLGWVFWIMAPQVSHLCPYWQGHSLGLEKVILEGFSFAPPGLFVQDQPLSLGVLVLESCLFFLPSPSMLFVCEWSSWKAHFWTLPSYQE